jgi:thioredoxin reductase (NADPH)
LGWAIVPHRHKDAYFKVLVDNKSGKIVGWHVLGPDAGEITQGVALAMKLGVKKEQLDDLVGIHPTLAETMCGMSGKKFAGVQCDT